MNTSTDKAVQKPHFSIVVPAYNAAETLRESVESVLSQSYPLFELIIVDDGSSDGTLELAQSFAQQYSKVKVESKPNGGTASAYNCGIELADAPWIVMLAADDLLAPQHLSNIAYELEVAQGFSIGEAKPSDYVLVTTNGWYQFPDGSLKLFAQTSASDTRDACLEEMIATKLFAVGAAFTKESWERVGGFDGRFFAEDWWFFLRILASGGGWIRVGEPSSYHRISKTQKSLRGLLVRKDDLRALGCLVDLYDLDDCVLVAIEAKKQSIEKSLKLRQKMYSLFGEDLSESMIAVRRKFRP